MKFEYADAICIKEEDLDYMAYEVKNGCHLLVVYNMILRNYDDDIWYNRMKVYHKVKEEVMKRV